MAAIPQFTPAQTPQTGAQLNLQAGNDQQSWLTQAETRKQIQATAAQTQQQTAQQQILTPVLQAKANADIAGARNDLASAQYQQDLRAQWQSLKPQLVQDYGQVMDPNNITYEADGTPDWTARYNQLETMEAKYAPLADLPEGKAYYTMIQNAKKNAFAMAAQHLQAQTYLTRLKVGGDIRGEQIDRAAKDRAATTAITAPITAEANATADIAKKQSEALDKQRMDTFNTIASRRDQLNQTNASLDKLDQDVTAQQSSTLGSGPGFSNGVVGAFRPTVQNVKSDMSSFVPQVMANAKNIRTQQEFNAYTGAIVAPTDPAPVQNEKKAFMRAANGVLSQRNDYMEKTLRADPKLSPDEADAQAITKFPFPRAGSWAHQPATQQDARAIQWAKANPGNPAAAQILQVNGVQ